MNLNLHEELLRVKEQIEKEYDIIGTIRLNILDKEELLLEAEQYDIEIQIWDRDKNNWLNGEYGVSLDAMANKKWASKLSYHGVGCLELYNFENIRKFIEQYGVKKKGFKQLDLFNSNI